MAVNDKEPKSGPATKADVAAMKANARESDSQLQDAYESGVDEGKQQSSSSSAAGRSPGSSSGRLSFSNDAQKVIVIAMTITVIVSLIENANAKNTTVRSSFGRIVIGGFISTALLLGGSYFVPEFASGLSIVALVATVLERGKPFWDVVASVTGRAQPSPIPPKAPVATPIPMQPNYGTAAYHPTTTNPILYT